MPQRTLTLKFGPQNQYALMMPAGIAAKAELVFDAADAEHAARLQAAPTQQQFEWMLKHEEQLEHTAARD